MSEDTPPPTVLPASPTPGSTLSEQIAETVAEWALMYPLANWPQWGNIGSADDREHLDAIANKIAAAWGSDIAERALAVVQPALDERDRFADLLSWQIKLHTQRPNHEHLNRRACQNCQQFAAISEHPVIVAAREQRMRAIAEALRTGNFIACQAPEDRGEA